MSAGLFGSHFAIADVQQTGSFQSLVNPINQGHVDRVIGLLSRKHFTDQRNPKWVQGGQGNFDLRQVWSVIFRMSQLQQSFFVHLA